MNITFLVGNGFDIACGLHTSYGDFYKWLFAHQTDNLRVERLKNSLDEDKSTNNNYWADFELWLGQYTKGFNEPFLDEYLEAYDSVHESMIQFISSEREKLSNQFLSQDSVKSLKESVLHFYQELDPLSKESIQSEINSRTEDVAFQFVTFNYTDCIDLCVSELSKEPLLVQSTGYGKKQFYVKPDTIHVHGSIGHFPVLGVCNEMFVKNKELLKNSEFVNLFIKEKNVQSIGETWYRDVKHQIESSDIVCIFGLSLGASDSMWWNEVVKWMRATNHHHLVVFWHSDSEMSANSSFQYNREKTRIQKLLTDYSELKPQERLEINSRIHIVFNSRKMLNTLVES